MGSNILSEESMKRSADADFQARVIFLQLGLLDHPPQHDAFKQLIITFVQAEAKKARIKPAKLSADDIETLAAGFMEEYEQRLWPKELDLPRRKHLNNPDALISPDHGMSGHVRYTIEGRYSAAP